MATKRDRKAEGAAYRARTKERRAEYARKWREEHPDYFAAYTAEHRDEFKEYARKYKKVNKEKYNARASNIRAARLQCEGTHTADEWQAILDYSGGRCYACGSKDNIHKDHIVPLARGGTNYANNLQPLCRDCNLAKHTQTIDYRRRSDWLWI